MHDTRMNYVPMMRMLLFRKIEKCPCESCKHLMRDLEHDAAETFKVYHMRNIAKVNCMQATMLVSLIFLLSSFIVVLVFFIVQPYEENEANKHASHVAVLIFSGVGVFSGLLAGVSWCLIPEPEYDFPKEKEVPLLHAHADADARTPQSP